MRLKRAAAKQQVKGKKTMAIVCNAETLSNVYLFIVHFSLTDYSLKKGCLLRQILPEVLSHTQTFVLLPGRHLQGFYPSATNTTGTALTGMMEVKEAKP